MTQADPEHLKRQSLAYQLAADDMGQAIAAGIALRDEEDNRNLMLALECAMAVCYMRAFQSGLRISGKFEPALARGYSEEDVKLHEWFDDRRDKAYAHTDEELSGRVASVDPLEGEPAGAAAWALGWVPFPREWIDPAIDLFLRQREHFRTKALEVERQIEASQ